MSCEVSIITPVFNSEKFVEETMQSAISQTFSDWEMLLIMDKGTTDNSREIIRKYEEKDSRIKYLFAEDSKNVIDARNFGIERAEGRYIAFLDSDDLWKPDKLKKQLDAMKENNECFSFTAYETISEKGEYVSVFHPPKDFIDYSDLLKSDHVGCLTAVLDSQILGKRFFEKTSGAEDYILWLSILREGHKAHCVNENLASYRIVENSYSSNKWNKVKLQWHIYRNTQNQSIFSSLFNMVFYAYWGLKKNWQRILREGKS